MLENYIDWNDPKYANLKPYADAMIKAEARAKELAEMNLPVESATAVINAEFDLELYGPVDFPALLDGTMSIQKFREEMTRKASREYYNSPRFKRWQQLTAGYEAGLWGLLSHELNEISRLADDPRRVRQTADFLKSMLKDVLIGDKEIPALFLNEYAAASLHVYRAARAGKATQVCAYDAERNSIHEAILQYADEERGSEWEELLEKELAKRCNESLDASERRHQEEG